MEAKYYPYKSGKKEEVFNCKYDKSKVDSLSKIPEYKKITKPKIDDIKKYIIKKGPVSTGIFAGCQLFQDYTDKDGIMSFTKEECDNSPKSADHLVTIVGWGKLQKIIGL